MRPTIVLLHGFTQTGASWMPLMGALGERYSALAPDIRGHGGARERRPVSFEECVADIARLVEGPFALCGYSMGGRVALRAALELGAERVTRLTLIGASGGFADAEERDARRRSDAALADELERSTIESFARRWAAQPLLADQPADVAAAAHADRLRNDPRALAAALRGLGTGTMEPLWERLGELEMAVTLIAGQRDRKYGAIADSMARRIALAKVVVVDGAGHAAHLEAPSRVAARL